MWIKVDEPLYVFYYFQWSIDGSSGWKPQRGNRWYLVG
jgi:hypothetical protein